jgi:hypothetical protein
MMFENNVKFSDCAYFAVLSQHLPGNRAEKCHTPPMGGVLIGRGVCRVSRQAGRQAGRQAAVISRRHIIISYFTCIF